MAETVGALRSLEEAVTKAGGIVLRYGNFYGAANDGLIEPVSKRQFLIAGDGGGSPRSSISRTPPPQRHSLSSTTARQSTTSSTTTQPGTRVAASRVAASTGGRARSRTTPPLPTLARPTLRRRSRCDVGNGGSRRLEHQGQARAWLAAALPELAPGLRRGICDGGRAGRAPGRQRTSARCLRARRYISTPALAFGFGVAVESGRNPPLGLRCSCLSLGHATVCVRCSADHPIPPCVDISDNAPSRTVPTERITDEGVAVGA